MLRSALSRSLGVGLLWSGAAMARVIEREEWQQAVADVIRQAQDYALVNDSYVGSSNDISATGGEQIGLDELNLGGWGGFTPYTLGF